MAESLFGVPVSGLAETLFNQPVAVATLVA